ncbi:DUF2064 domain-containing protein [Actinoallomurus bryophytorum]|uniref:Glycosyltransferase A (GT-A) superfamily protein (DUF2064 family) n=1 Tax=Actinoallomurus bryophytorum TaxID=1490222 RepID=A0A543CHR9_9ACTN|nr:DUF2064 domain-containing protein [Actinoallomurus bryophytorum]TQL96636.1 hypothetical protein FB559_2176 [Actinoallomurus bryophytorum]
MILLVMAKAPVPGRVKTRLCPPATPEQAAAIAAAALLDTLDAVGAFPGGRTVLALAGDPADVRCGSELTSVLRKVRIIRQRGSCLGERIAAAHLDASAMLPGLPILQVGMDTPQIDRGLLETCRRRLHAPGVDAVLGPADDGGWWALGLRDPKAASAIAGVETSLPDTGARTEQALRRRGLRLALLPALSDVDTVEDAVRVAAAAPMTRFAAEVGKLL